jgi:hypothetical protein
MTLTSTGVPDLLRRFAPAPYSEIIGAGDIALRVETNDPAIISEMQQAGVQRSHRDSGGLLFLKVIRDKDAPCGGRAVIVLSAYPLVTLRVGIGTMIMLDCERREALGFLAPELTAKEFAGTLFPLICNLLVNSISATAPSQTCQ